MKLKKAGYNVSDICRCLYVKRSTFYARCKVKPINADHVRLTAAIEHVHNEMDATYGSRRMKKAMNLLGFAIGREKARNLMKEAEVPVRHRKKYKVTTNSNHKQVVYKSQ